VKFKSPVFAFFKKTGRVKILKRHTKIRMELGSIELGGWPGQLQPGLENEKIFRVSILKIWVT
jgi:hypothetical protein